MRLAATLDRPSNASRLPPIEWQPDSAEYAELFDLTVADPLGTPTIATYCGPPQQYSFAAQGDTVIVRWFWYAIDRVEFACSTLTIATTSSSCTVMDQRRSACPESGVVDVNLFDGGAL